MTPFQIARNEYIRADRQGKPQLKAKWLLNATLTGTAAEVAEFVREVQVWAGKQDLDLLPETTWKLDGAPFDNRPEALAARAIAPHTNALRNVIDSESVSRVRISWPSVTSHWGVAVFWTDGDRDYRAFSSDYQLTETYLSS